MSGEPVGGAGGAAPAEQDGERGEPGEGIVRSGRLRLVLLSFLMLFVELALIRWSGSNIVYLSYFTNFVLLGSFLGIGLGFLRANAKVRLFPWFPLALAAFVGFVLLFPVEVDRSGSNLIFYGGSPKGLPIWVILPLVFLAVAGLMAMVAEGVARVFATFEPLEAYRLDLLGSMAGIIVFTGLSFLRAPPVAWGLVVVIVVVLASGRALKVAAYVGCAALVVFLALESMAPFDSWSPYYKVTAFEPAEIPGGLAINVNGIPHQTMIPTELRRGLEPRLRPFEVTPEDPGRVLIIGAGNGLDISNALERGATHIDAVEIDPRVYEIGRDRNADHPYQDPRVRAIIDDGRAWLERTDEQYDLIMFALPDSLSLVSGQSSLRLESYLFTEEAITTARDHLAPDGAFVMYNSYREPWLIDRMAGTVGEVFGTAPCVDTFPEATGFAVISAAKDPSVLRCTSTWQPAGEVVAPATDDYPFPYLQSRSIPGFYVVTIFLLLGASLVLVRVVAGPLRSMRSFVDLFFMGAAFLLLETKSVVQFALLFGTTWFVNSLVFLGVLMSVYLAVEVSKRVRITRPLILYGLLLASLVVVWIVPESALLQLDPVPRFVAAASLAFAPIFLANMIFSQRFRDVSHSTTAFGANLLGAVVGGLLEYLALVTGYRNLLLLVAVLYGLAFLTGRHLWMRDGEAPVPQVSPAGSDVP